jgi:hypothetical protein
MTFVIYHHDAIGILASKLRHASDGHLFIISWQYCRNSAQTTPPTPNIGKSLFDFFEFCKAARWMFCSLFFIDVPDGETRFRELCLLRVQE